MTNKKVDRNLQARQKRFAKNARARGMVKVSPWVPEHRRDELLEIAANMRAEHEASYSEDSGNSAEEVAQSP